MKIGKNPLHVCEMEIILMDTNLLCQNKDTLFSEVYFTSPVCEEVVSDVFLIS